ncbi:hypothetical protein Cal7507_5401 [Calothrix sp. PCC 7507]|nr:hypothetical protein Cal7507_5401 [Calothrix sp. PCC 7507]
MFYFFFSTTIINFKNLTVLNNTHKTNNLSGHNSEIRIFCQQFKYNFLLSIIFFMTTKKSIILVSKELYISFIKSSNYKSIILDKENLRY